MTGTFLNPEQRRVVITYLARELAKLHRYIRGQETRRGGPNRKALNRLVVKWEYLRDLKRELEGKE